MSNKPFKEFLKLIKLGAPVAISQLGYVLVGLVDTVMAGQLGSVPLAAATFAVNAVIPFTMFLIGFSYGITPLISQALGENKNTRISSIFRNALMVNILFSVLVSGLIYLLSDLLQFAGQPLEVLQSGLPFFKIMVLSMIPLQIFCAHKQYLDGLSRTAEPMVISILSNLLNIFLNYVLIFGKLGAPAYGLMGSAYATLLSRIFMAVAISGYIHFFSSYRIDGSWRSHWISKSELFRITKLSLPIGLQLVLESGAFSVAAIMAGWIGTVALDAHQIALNLAAISYMVATGISAAATIQVAMEYGRKVKGNVKKAARMAYLLVILFEGCTMILFILMNNILPLIYISDHDIVSTASSLLIIAALFQISDGLQTVGLGILRGIQDVKIPTTIAIVSYWIIGLPLAYVLGFTLKLGISGIWYGLLVGLTAAAILIFLRYKNRIQLLE